MEDLIITLVQTSLAWESKSANLDQLNLKLEQITETDLIILPEMFNTGFSMASAKLAETMDGATVKWMKKQAIDRKAVVTGSVIIKEEGNYFNRLIWALPDGEIKFYDKRHLFRMMNEHHHFTAGKNKLLVTLKGWKICPMICYDLRFPVWSRNTDQYDLLIFVANWPEARRSAWKVLLVARAIENLCYVAGVNRVGEDGNNIPFSGDSAVINPKGDYLLKMEPNEEMVKTTMLSKKELERFRKKFPAHLDADQFSIDL